MNPRSGDSGTGSTGRLGETTEEAARNIRSAGADAAEAGNDMLAAAREAAATAASAVGSQTTRLMSNAAEELSVTAEEQIAKGADAVKDFAHALGRAAGEFESPSPMLAGQIRNAAGQLEGFSSTLKNHSVNELVAAASDLAKKQPAAFFAGAVVAGFAASRLLMSRPQMNAQQGDSGTRPGPRLPGSDQWRG